MQGGQEDTLSWTDCNADISIRVTYEKVSFGDTDEFQVYMRPRRHEKETLKNTHSFARRRRSDAGASNDPTPTAAVPFNGKKPWSPMIAGRMTERKVVIVINNEAKIIQNRAFSFLRKRKGSKARAPVRTPHAGCQSSS